MANIVSYYCAINGITSLPIQSAQPSLLEIHEITIPNFPLIQQIISLINIDSWYEYIVSLTSHNRYAKQDGIIDAGKFIQACFDDFDKKYSADLKITLQPVPILSERYFNVIVALQGQGPVASGAPNPYSIVIGGHYDSISENPIASAPGAVDNASGSAGVLEIARILCQQVKNIPSNITFIFNLYVGEELGFHGSIEYVKSLDIKCIKQIKLMFNLDMIGWGNNPNGNKILIATDPKYEIVYKKLFEKVYNQFKIDLPLVLDLSLKGRSDHLIFLRKNIPAVLIANDNCKTYVHYHRTTDLPKEVSKEVGKQILELVLGVVAMLGIGDSIVEYEHPN